MKTFAAVVVTTVCRAIWATDGPISPVGPGAALPSSVAPASFCDVPTMMRQRPESAAQKFTGLTLAFTTHVPAGTVTARIATGAPVSERNLLVLLLRAITSA